MLPALAAEVTCAIHHQKGPMVEDIELRCCLCNKSVDRQETDGSQIQLKKFGASTPEMLWAHGVCLRAAIPLIGVQIP